MKTLKLTLVATIVAFALVSVAHADGFKNKPKFGKSVTISLSEAVNDPGLVAAMYEQINPLDVLHFPLPPIIAVVTYNGNTYRITGTRLEWLRFFRFQGEHPSTKKIRQLEL